MNPCLICCYKAEGTFLNENINSKSQLEQLNELLQVFQISLTSFHSLDQSRTNEGENEPPPKLFCRKCSDELEDAIYTLSRIQALQNELRIVKEYLKRKLLQSQVEDGGSKWVQNVRQTLVQCFSTCKVTLEHSMAGSEPEQDVNERLDVEVKIEGDSFSKEVWMEKDNAAPEGLSDLMNEDEDNFNFRMEIFFPEYVEEEVEVEEGTTVDGELQETEQESEIERKQEAGMSLVCNRCDLSFGNYTALNRHKRKVHGVGKLCPCPHCEYKTYRADILAGHIRRLHEIGTGASQEKTESKRLSAISRFTCQHCLKTFKKEECEQVSSAGAVFKCFLPNCDRIYSSFVRFREHHLSTCLDGNLLGLEEEKGARIFICNMCGFRGGNSTAMCRHRSKVHGLGKLAQCPYCDYRCYRSDLLATHVKRKHRELRKDGQNENTNESEQEVSAGPANFHSFLCKYCSKIYKKEECEQVTSSGTVFKCFLPNCEEICSSFLTFRIHHESTCPDRNVGVLEEEGQNQKPTRTFICHKCGLRFYNYSTLGRHKRKVHNLGKLYQCPHCEYRCYRSDLLATHVKRKHKELSTDSQWQPTGGLTQEEPTVSEAFRCKHCWKLYMRSECEQISSFGVAFKCLIPDCEEVCGSFSEFRDHHESTCTSRDSKVPQLPQICGRILVCDRCGLQCSNQTALTRHKRKDHNGTVLQCDKCEYKCHRTDMLKRHILSAH